MHQENVKLLIVAYFYLFLLSTDDLLGVAGAGVLKDLKLRRARCRSSLLAANIALGGEIFFREQRPSRVSMHENLLKQMGTCSDDDCGRSVKISVKIYRNRNAIHAALLHALQLEFVQHS